MIRAKYSQMVKIANLQLLTQLISFDMPKIHFHLPPTPKKKLVHKYIFIPEEKVSLQILI